MEFYSGWGRCQSVWVCERYILYTSFKCVSLCEFTWKFVRFSFASAEHFQSRNAVVLSKHRGSHKLRTQMCVPVHVNVCVCYSSTSSHLGNRLCSLNSSFFPSLGTHSFRPNPVHSLLMLTLVPEAICRLHSSCFCGNKEEQNNTERASFVGAPLGDHPSFLANSGHLFTPVRLV